METKWSILITLNGAPKGWSYRWFSVAAYKYSI